MSRKKLPGKPHPARRALAAKRSPEDSESSRWTPERIALLGTMTDRELAQRLGLSVPIVGKERLRRRIPPFRKSRPKIRWAPEDIALLGTASDREIADRLGYYPKAVTAKRWLLGIPVWSAWVWSVDDLALLGTMSDHQLGKKLGLEPRKIGRKRRELGIPVFGALPWQQAEETLLGTMPDEVVAEKLDRPVTAVQARRQKLRIPQVVSPKPQRRPAMSPIPVQRTQIRPKKISWTPRMVALLGAMTDALVAHRLRMSAQTVARERRRRGIPAFGWAPQRIEWTAEMVALLGTDSDSNVAAELGLASTYVANKRRMLGIPPCCHESISQNGYPWRPEQLALLGKMPDRKVAEILGLSWSMVFYRRRVLGIPAFIPATRITWSPEMIEALGKMLDTEVAQRHGISSASVKRKREELGIPLFRADLQPFERTEKLLDLLRAFSSAEVRRLTGLGEVSIRRLRVEHGIKPPAESTEQRWPAQSIAKLGTAHDHEVARDLGLSHGQVRKKRQSLGIPAYRGAARVASPPAKRSARSNPRRGGLAKKR